MNAARRWVAGQRVVFKLAWRYLKGRGLRTVLTTLAVALGVMLIFGVNGLMPTLIEAFTRSLVSSAGRIELTVSSSLGQPFEPRVLDQVARLDGVAVATPEVELTAPVPERRGVPASEQVAQVSVIGVDPALTSRVRDFPVASGRALEVGDRAVAVLPSDLAGRLGVAVGDELALPSSVGTTRFTVVGLLSTPAPPGEQPVYVPLSEAQRLFALGDRITTIQASLTPDADPTKVEASVRDALGADYRVGGLASSATLLSGVDIAATTMNLIGVFALATAGFIILNSFRTVVAERRRDVGMLRAIGTPRRTIERVFLAEALFQGVIGTAVGVLLGWGMASAMFAFMAPITQMYMRIDIGPVVFLPSTWVWTIVLGIGVTVLAAWLPARAAGRVTPTEAMRPQVGEVVERRVGVRAWVGLGLLIVSLFGIATRQASLVGAGAVLFLVAIALVAPAVVNPLAKLFGNAVELAFAREGAIARSNLQRNPGRSATTVTAVMLGLASIVAIISVVAAMFAGFYSYIDKSLGSDYIVMPTSMLLQQGNVAAGPRLSEELHHVDGVGVVSTLRLAQGRVGELDTQVISIDPDTYGEIADFEWSPGSSPGAISQLTQGRWLIANGIFTGQAGLEPGMVVEVATPNGPRSFTVAGVGTDYLNAKLATVYVSHEVMARDFNTTSDLLLLASRRSDADPDATRDRVQRLVDGFPAFKLYESQEWKDEQVAAFDASAVIFRVLIGALAIPSLLALLNTLAISVLARTREIGILRAMGATRRQVRRMVVAESLLLSVIGTGFGVVAGVFLGYALVLATAAVGWPMPYLFPWDGVLITIAVGIVFGVVAAAVPARTASNLRVVDALRHD